MEGKWEESASVTGTTTEECGGSPERRQEEVGRVRARKQHPCTHISAGAEGSAASLGEVRIAGAGDSAMQPALKNNTCDHDHQETVAAQRWAWLLHGFPRPLAALQCWNLPLHLTYCFTNTPHPHPPVAGSQPYGNSLLNVTFPLAAISAAKPYQPPRCRGGFLHGPEMSILFHWGFLTPPPFYFGEFVSLVGHLFLLS